MYWSRLKSQDNSIIAGDSESNTADNLDAAASAPISAGAAADPPGNHGDTTATRASISTLPASASGPQPAATLAAAAVQLQPHSYTGSAGSSGSSGSGDNVTAAWRYSTGASTTVALIDDGFDPLITQSYTRFDTALSRNLGVGLPTDLSEPAGSLHGTTTSAEIGDPGNSGQAIGIAPQATVIGVKVTFGNLPIGTLTYALTYAAALSDVVNNSWCYGSFGDGEVWSPGCAAWYGAVQTAIQTDRDGLGTVIVFAAGNNRAEHDDLALHPMEADPRVIAVAAVNADGTVASYSNSGAGLLVAAVGNNITAPGYGASYTTATSSGTSFAAPIISGIVSLMLSANPTLGWRDVQEILADSAYAPAASRNGFVTNHATDWNGGGRHFSNDLGFGVVDANVAVNLALAWTGQETSTNLISTASSYAMLARLTAKATICSYLSFFDDTRMQHVQVTIHDTNLLAAATRIVLISPSGTQSVLMNQPGEVGSYDNTNGLDLNNCVLTSNAFWGEEASGVWTLEVQDLKGAASALVWGWNLTVWGDNATTLASPLVYTPEFAGLAAGAATRTVVSPNGTDTIDLIALPGACSINLNGGPGLIDGVAVTVQPGLRNANANGCTGSVTLIGATGGGELTGGDGPTTISGAGHDIIHGGLGATTINTGAGGDTITLSDAAASATQDSITSGGGDTITAGSATVTITASGAIGDTIDPQGARLTFINGSGSSIVQSGTGSVHVQGGIGGGTFYAGTGGNNVLTGGSGRVVLYGAAAGDVLTAAGTANDVLIAGAGGETLNGGSATGNITLIGGPGNDIMTAGLGRTAFTSGAGNDQITLGGIADTITIQDGAAEGLSVIRGFRIGIDDLHLLGFAAGTAGAAVQAQTSDGASGTMLCLPDGTHIDLVGLAHVTTSAFA